MHTLPISIVGSIVIGGIVPTLIKWVDSGRIYPLLSRITHIFAKEAILDENWFNVVNRLVNYHSQHSHRKGRVNL